MSKVTVTGKVGPGLTATTQVINNVTRIALDTDNEVLFVDSGGVRSEFDVGAGTTITITVSGNNYTIAFS